jgi:hypothetical protein
MDTDSTSAMPPQPKNNKNKRIILFASVGIIIIAIVTVAILLIREASVDRQSVRESATRISESLRALSSDYGDEYLQFAASVENWQSGDAIYLVEPETLQNIRGATRDLSADYLVIANNLSGHDASFDALRIATGGAVQQLPPSIINTYALAKLQTDYGLALFPSIAIDATNKLCSLCSTVVDPNNMLVSTDELSAKTSYEERFTLVIQKYLYDNMQTDVTNIDSLRDSLLQYRNTLLDISETDVCAVDDMTLCIAGRTIDAREDIYRSMDAILSSRKVIPADGSEYGLDALADYFSELASKYAD